MPTWGDLVHELSRTITPQRPVPDHDVIRRKYLAALAALTGRNVIYYASAWLQNKPNVSPALLSIGGEDIGGFMETIHGLQGDAVDLILHSPGGEIEAAEALVTYLRARFSDIRVIVPGMAMSAATMMACAGNRIVMGKHSFLGPIDPQFIVNTATGPRQVAAFAILEQFELAKKECQDATKLAAWLPMLAQYGPEFLIKSF
jgi:ClpP class serine protease